MKVARDKFKHCLLLRVRSGPFGRQFCAGLLYDSRCDRIVYTAPILRPLSGSNEKTLREMAWQNGWTVTVVPRRKNESAEQ